MSLQFPRFDKEPSRHYVTLHSVALVQAKNIILCHSESIAKKHVWPLVSNEQAEG